jgi:hypothetical protein
MNINKLIDRAKNICMVPQAEWQVIAGEETTAQKLFTDYAIWLAAISAVGGLLTALFLVRFGFGVMFFAVVGVVVQFVLGLGMLYALSYVYDALAPSFGGQKSGLNGLKLAVYSFTPFFLAGVVSFLPFHLGHLALIAAAAYGFYIFYLGCQPLLSIPEDKAVGFTIVSIVIGVVIGAIAGFVIGAITLIGAGGAAVVGGALR